jgi:hypothetical protein
MALADRAVALAGIAGAVLILLFVSLTEPSGSPDDPSSALARALVDNRDSARTGAHIGLIAVFFLIMFMSQLYGTLRDASGPTSWFPTLALVGGILLSGVLLTEVGFAFASSELASYGEDTQIAKLFILWPWNSANLLAPPFAALLAGGTLVAFSADAFPTWFRWAGAVLLTLMLLIAGVLRAPGLATAPGTLWIILASGMLASRPGRKSQP